MISSLPFESLLSNREASSGVMEPEVGYDEKLGECVKLFVGQIPKTWEEDELRPVLEAFGPIEELTVLRDRAYPGSGRSRGG